MRNDSLDGVRCIAILLVVGFHYKVPGFEAGYIGVDVFFVLSGFLITTKILEDVYARRFSLLQFYRRRVLRLFPALFALVLVVTFWNRFVVLEQEDYDNNKRAINNALFYNANWYFIGAMDYFGLDSFKNVILHTWSLSIEEQFYFVWPLVVWTASRFTNSHTRLNRVLVALTASAILFSVARLESLSDKMSRAYLGTDSKIFEPLVGCLLAVLVHGVAIGRRWHYAFAALGLLGIYWGNTHLWQRAINEDDVPGTTFTMMYYQIGAVVVTVGSAMLIGALTSHRRSLVSRAIGNPVFAYIGRISYSMYLWHWPIHMWMREHEWWEVRGITFGWLVVLKVVLTFAIASVSYFVIERPFQKSVWLKGVSSKKVLVAFALLVLALFCLNTYSGFHGAVARYEDPIQSFDLTKNETRNALNETESEDPSLNTTNLNDTLPNPKSNETSSHNNGTENTKNNSTQ